MIYLLSNKYYMLYFQVLPSISTGVGKYSCLQWLVLVVVLGALDCICCGVEKTMDKVYRIADVEQPSTSITAVEENTDWDKCVICQKTQMKYFNAQQIQNTTQVELGTKPLQTTCWPLRKYTVCQLVLPHG